MADLTSNPGFYVPWKKSLRFRIMVRMAFVTLFTGAIMMVFMANIYQARIDYEFIFRAESIVKTTAYLLNAEDIDRYLLTGEKDDEYHRMLDLLRFKSQETGVRYITVSRIFENGETFVFDTDEDEVSHLDLGETIFWKEGETEPHLIPQFLSGGPVETYTHRTRWGWLLTAHEPILREDGTVAAHAAVSLSMDELLKQRRNGFLMLGAIILLILFSSTMIILHITQKFMISPIKKLSIGLDSYLPGAKEQLYNWQRRKPIMHHGDELELFERVLMEMESRVHLSMEAERRASGVKNAFLANMSHELRTPMNSTINMIKEAMTGNEQIKIMESLQQALASSNDLMSVLNTILEISNIESGSLVLSNAPFKPADVVIDINNIISTLCKANKIEWVPPGKINEDLWVEGDRIRVMQALTILLRNAVKYASEQNGRVIFSIDILEDSNGVTFYFKVSDNGIGMSDNKIEELRMIFSSDSSEIHFHSSEIMLYACSSIVKAMGALIMVESDNETGSIFSFSLTLNKAEAPKPVEVIDPSDFDFSGKKVLVADDVAINRSILEMILGETGIKTIEASDGKEAVDIFLSESDNIDLILMDIMMPNMDGYEAAGAIRSSGLPSASTVPIIAVTALSYKEDVDAAINAGMNSHISKPVDPNIVLTTLSRYFIN